MINPPTVEIDYTLQAVDVREARAILEEAGYQMNLATRIAIPNLMIPDWLIHDYIITGEVTNVHRS